MNTIEQKQSILVQLSKTCGDLAIKGWAERNAGNISVRLTEMEAAEFELDASTDWISLENPVPNLAKEVFYVTGTGKYLRNVPLSASANGGLLILDETGSRYRKVWGYENGANPTSELSAHLQAHGVRKTVSGGKDHVVLHTHPTNLVALTYAMQLDTKIMTRLLWEMHAECIVVFPEGVGYLPWMMAGSETIAGHTADMFKDRSMVVWEYHGIFASGEDLDEAFGLIDTAEKATGIYYAACQAGGVVKRPSADVLKAIAANFGKTPISGILES